MESLPFMFSNLLFMMVPIFMTIIFIIMIVMLISRAVHYSKNKSQPKLPVHAKVIAKRSNVSHRHHAGDNMHSSSHTSYYTTFEFDNGERMELSIPHNQFGFLVEGDEGILTIQGDMFIEFKRSL